MAENHFQPLEDLGEDPALGTAEQNLELENNMQRAGMIPQLMPGQNQAAQQGQQSGVPRQNQAAEPGSSLQARQRQQDEILPLQAVYASPAEPPKTFNALYSNPQKDPLINSYPLVLARFDAMIEEPEAPEDLLNAVLSNSTLPNTFLCCAVLNNARPRIYVLHKISRFPRAFDGRETPWDDALFGFLGDVTGTAVQTVRLPANPFAITQQITIYDDTTLAEELPRLRNDTLFPRLPLTHQQAVVVRTRTLMYLPTKYAPLLLNSRGVTPKEAWALLVPALQADGLVGFADPILFWLRASLHATQQNHRGPPATNSPLVNPFMDQELQTHCHAILVNALPSLQSPSALSYDPAIMHLANAVANQATVVREDRLAREIERDRPTMPSAKFQLLFRTLTSLLNVRNEAELPDFWFSLASATKKQEFGVIRQALDAYAHSPQAFISQAPIPTPKLVSDLTTVTLVANHNDDLKTGIQPFVVMDGSEEFRLATLKLAQSYMVLSEQQLGIQLSDLAQLDVPKDLRAHPTTFYGLEKSLGMFGNLTGTVLGNNHPITTAFRSFWRAFLGRKREMMHHEIDERKFIKPVHILRNVQLLTIQWFQAKLDGDTPANPAYLDILERIGLSMYTLPTLPGALYQLIAPKQPSVPKGPYNNDSATVATGLSTLTGTIVGTQPTTSVMSQGTFLSGNMSTGGTSANFIRNFNVDNELRSLLPPGIKILELLGNDPVPTGEDNSPICLSFHIKGGCYNNCRRKSNHAKTLSATEKQKLANWIMDQTAKLKARFTAP
jgi:hypothetical protein